MTSTPEGSVPEAPIPEAAEAVEHPVADDAAAAGDTVAHDGAGEDATLVEEGDIAADYLEELLDIADLDGDIDIDVVDGRAQIDIVSESGPLDQLLGRDGEVLEALQDLTRLAVQTSTGERSRLLLDISGYRAARRVELDRLAAEAIDTVRGGEASVKLAPMNPYERKIVHDAVKEAGLTSSSEGAGDQRAVVVTPA